MVETLDSDTKRGQGPKERDEKGREWNKISFLHSMLKVGPDFWSLNKT